MKATYRNTVQKYRNISKYFFPVSCTPIDHYCPPLSQKRGDIKSHLSVCLSFRPSLRPSLCLSVTKTLTLAITFALLQVELWYLACVFFATRPFRWYHIVTLTVTFDLLQGQICCRAGDHNSLNLLVLLYILTRKKIYWQMWSEGQCGEYANIIDMKKENSRISFKLTKSMSRLAETVIG